MLMPFRVHLQRFLALFVVCGALTAGGNCAGPDVYNSGDPASEEYYLQSLLRCALQDPQVCPALAASSGTPVSQIQPGAIGSNLRLWLEADTLGLGNGVPVSSWLDQSGNNFHASQGSGGLQPAYQLSAIGGQPAVRFNNLANPGTHLHLGANYVYSTNDGLTVLAVVRSSAEDDARDFILDFGAFGPAGYGLGYSANSDGVGDSVAFYTGSNVAVGGSVDEVPLLSSVTDNIVIVARIKFSPAADKHQSIYTNGTLLNANTAHTVTQLTAGEICEATTRGGASADVPAGAGCGFGGDSSPVVIGGQGKTPSETGRFFDGDIALVLVFDRALTDSERRGLECYASLKYGITVSQNCI